MSNKKVYRAIKGALEQIDSKHSKSNIGRAYMRIMFPYQVTKCGLILNREYKPLGIGGCKWDNFINYEEYPELMISEESTKRAIKLLSARNGISEGYFFNDANTPWGTKGCFNEYVDLIYKFLELIK